jgi:protein SCO1
MKKNILFAAFFSLLFFACKEENKYPSGLPVIGFKQLVEKEVNGQKIIDSLDHVIPPFSFVNQEGRTITEKDVEGKIYLVDFFFTSCPTICPRVKKNMKKVYEKYKDDPDFLILSHSIDTKYDTVGRLAWYAEKFKIDSQKWYLLTGKKEDIYKMAYEYYITALEDKEAEGGFDHSGAIALVDKHRRIRGMYDGTDAEKVAQLMLDVEKLKIEN